MTRSVVTALLAAAGLSGAARGQAVLRFLTSTDGGQTWSSNVNSFPGGHVDVMVTLSYTGTSPAIAGLAAANFQPIVSNWKSGANGDHLSTIMQGGNDVGGMVQPMAGASGLGSPNPYLTPTPGFNGAPVPTGPYVANTYGRVYPMGRVTQDGAQAITAFVHTNPPPDQTGRTYFPGTYLRFAEANNVDWFNSATNNSGTHGLNFGQMFLDGRTTSDPDFWGNQDMVYDPGDPDNGVPASWIATANGHNERRQNIQLFRFAIDFSPVQIDGRVLVLDAPLAGMMMNQAGTARAVSFYSRSGVGTEFNFGAGGTATVLTGSIFVPPAPGALGLGWMCLVFAARRRRAG